MRTHLSVLTIFWIAAGLGALPFLYLMLAFANDNPTPAVRMVSTYLLLFYLQLIAQSFIASASLKYIRSLRQYLYAILIILLAPVLLLIGALVSAGSFSELIFQIALFMMLALQLIGSIWMWGILGKREKQAIIVASPTVAEPPHTDPNVSSRLPRKPRRSIAHILLYAPVAIFLLTLSLTFIVSITAAVYPSLSLMQSPVLKSFFNGLGILLGFSLLPCLVAGIYLMVRRGKS